MLGGKTLPRRDFLRHAVMLAGAGVTAPLWAAMKYNRDAATRSGSPIGVFGEMSVLKVKGDLRADGARVFARDIHSAPGTLVSTRLQS